MDVFYFYNKSTVGNYFLQIIQLDTGVRGMAALIDRCPNTGSLSQPQIQ